MLVIWLVVLMGINGSQFFKFYNEDNSVQSDSVKYKILLVNLHHENVEYEKVLRMIRGENPQFIMFIEFTAKWYESLEFELKKFPSSEIMLRDDAAGIGFFSMLEFEASQIRFIGDTTIPSITARLRISGKRLRLIGIHLMSPLSPYYYNHRNGQLDALKEFLALDNESVIVLGDMNMTPWSPVFNEFIEGTQMRDARVGKGLNVSWPAQFPLLGIPIDHFLASSDVVVHTFKKLPGIGSDHYPLVIEFSTRS